MDPTLCVKTGMDEEAKIARAFFRPSSTFFLSGQQTVESMQAQVPASVKGVLTFGLCGGLAPAAQIGQAFIYSHVRTPDGIFPADTIWRQRAFQATRYYVQPCYSSGDFNTANTIVQRKNLYTQTGCWVIDDESRTVVEFALARNLRWLGLRVVSDGAEDNLPPAVKNALNPDGTTNFWDVVESAITEPIDPLTKEFQIGELVKTAQEADLAYRELRTAALTIGGDASFQA